MVSLRESLEKLVEETIDCMNLDQPMATLIVNATYTSVGGEVVHATFTKSAGHPERISRIRLR